MLLPLDGSDRAWLEDRGPRLTLVAAIDDATGTVPAALFRAEEDAAGDRELRRRVVTTVGRPAAVYHDRHGIFVRAPGERETGAEQLAGERAPTQVGRAVRALGVASVAAGSPQARGRIERLFGTRQDRLGAELRLAGAATPAAAAAVLAAFLPRCNARFNARFAVPAAAAGSASRPLAAGTDADQVCCVADGRTLGRDDTVRLGEHRRQLLPGRARATLARAKVEVREHLDGALSVWHQGQRVASQAAPPEAPVLRARKNTGALGAAGAPAGPSAPAPPPAAPGAAPSPRPGPNHPWRRPLTSRDPEPGVTHSRTSEGDRITGQ